MKSIARCRSSSVIGILHFEKKFSASPVSVFSHDIDQGIEPSVSVSTGVSESRKLFIDDCYLLQEPQVMFTHVLSRAPACPDHQFQNPFVSIESPFSFPVRLIKLLNVDRELRLLFDDKIHCTLSLFVGHWALSSVAIWKRG
jgi:hypothetical protein